MKHNGHIRLESGGASEFQNAIIERVSTIPAVVAQERGRIVFSTTDSSFYFNNGSSWVSLATGGNASALQSEVDAIESALGSMVSSAGNFVAPTGTNFVNGASSVSDAILLLDSAVSGKNELRELLDVNIPAPTDKQVLYYDNTSGKWIAHTVVLSDVSDVTATAAEVNELHTAGAVTADFAKLHAVTATAAELNILAGATVTTTEVNYLDGVTSGVQSQLDNKQPLDAQLTSIAGLTPTTNQALFGDGSGGYLLDAGAGARSRLGAVIGTDVQAYDADLQQIAGFAPAAGSTGDGASGTTQHDIMVSTGGAEGVRWSLKRGAQARDALGLGDVAIHDNAEYVRVDGTHVMSANFNMNAFKITNLATPDNATDAANKAYVDANISGLVWLNPVELSNLTGTATAPVGSPAQADSYIIGTGGNTGDWSAFAVGDVVQWQTSAWVKIKSVEIGDRFGIMFQGATASSGDFVGLENSIVTITGGTPGAYTFSTYTPVVGRAVFVQNINAYLFGHSYTYVDETSSWVEFSGPTATAAGTGLYYSGNTMHINLGAGIRELPSDEVGLDLYDNASSALILTNDGSSRETSASARLHLLLDLDGSGQLVQSSSGLRIAGSGVSEVELAATVAGDGLEGGAGSPLSVVSAAGDAGTVGTLVVTADSVGVALGTTSTTAARGDHVHAASVVTFDNYELTFASGTSNVQAALADLDARVFALSTTTVSDLQAEVNTIETSVGLATDGTLSGSLPGAQSNVIAALNYVDNAQSTGLTAINTAVTGMYHLYTSGATSTSHTVTHNIGSKYCNVTVVDEFDAVIIPQDIIFNSATQLTVTFNTAINCKVVVMGQYVA